MQFLRSLAMFAAANLLWLALTGVHLGGDSGLFVDGGRRLLEGQPLVDREPSYVGYAAVVAASQALGAGLLGVVLFQIAVATLGAGAVYRLGMELGGARVAAIATGLLTIDFDVNRWHTYVLADSLFISAFAVSVWLVHHAAKVGRGDKPSAFARSASADRRSLGGGWLGLSFKWYAAALVVLIATSLVRPEGWFAIPAAGLYWVARGIKSGAPRLAVSGGVVVACLIGALIVAPRLSGNLSAVNPAAMLERGQTIWDYEGWRLAMPASVDSAQSGQAPGPIAYAMRHPIATAELMLARLGVHLAHIRPFYSSAHNVAIVVWLLPVYALATIAVWRTWSQPLTRWCVAAFASQALVVALTHADWDGRYLAHVMPIVYPFVAAGLWTVVARRSQASSKRPQS